MRPLFYLHQSSMMGNGHPPCFPRMHPLAPVLPRSPARACAETPPAVWTKVLRGPTVEESPEVQEPPRLPASPPARIGAGPRSQAPMRSLIIP